MSYRVRKVFDINQAKRKPIGGVKGAVLEDDEGRQFLQLKIKNNSPNFLDRVPILIDCYDSEGVYLGTQGYTYENIIGLLESKDVPLNLNVTIYIKNLIKSINEKN